MLECFFAVVIVSNLVNKSAGKVDERMNPAKSFVFHEFVEVGTKELTRWRE